MKKSILLMSALFFCGMTALAQEPLYKMKLTLQDGSKLAALTDEIDSMQLTTVKAAEVHVTERYKTSSSIGINIEAEASVTRVQAAIVAGSEKDPNINYTEYVQKHSVCDAKGSYTLAFDFLKPESIYTVYVRIRRERSAHGSEEPYLLHGCRGRRSLHGHDDTRRNNNTQVQRHGQGRFREVLHLRHRL